MKIARIRAASPIPTIVGGAILHLDPLFASCGGAPAVRVGMVSRDTPSFGTVLKRLRIAASLSQEALAERAGLSSRGISDLERDVRQYPHLSTVSLLADALALEPAERRMLLAAARPATLGQIEQAPPAGPARIPVPLTPLVGREHEIESLGALLRGEEVRLVTVTGPGGVGKTRLALAVARESADAFAGGAIFVSLAQVRDPGLVGSAIAQAVGIRALGSRSVRELLTEHLQHRHVLLVLDNFEHLLDAAPLVAHLLATCPRLTVLATSRAALRLSGEHDVPISPLALPAPDRPATLDDLAGVASVRLFVQRARSADPGFALADANAAAVTEIVRRVDGLPLAIELAAARVKLLPPTAMLARLEPRLPLLSGGSRDLPARLRTMRDAIAWSYDLLAPPEQALFRRLAVFAGGFTLEAAEAVAGDLDADVLVGLAGLVDQSLVRQRRSGFRYLMLETVREFALERLDSSGEGESARAAHATYFLSLAEQAATEYWGAQESIWLDQLEVEQSNLRAAQSWFERESQTALALRLAAACFRFWRVRGPVAEGRTAMERALALPGQPLDSVRVLVALFTGEFAYIQGDDAADRERVQEALALARELDDPAVLAFALSSNARAALELDNASEAEALWEQAVSLARTVDERSVAFHYVGPILEHLGFIARQRGDLARAAVLTEEALAWSESIDFEWSAAMILGSLAAVKREQGELRRAARLYRESLRRVWAQRDRRNFASALFGFALTVAASGQSELAARLCGAAEALIEADATALPFLGRPDRSRLFALLRATLGEERFAAEQAVGGGLSPEQVLELAEEVAI